MRVVKACDDFNCCGNYLLYMLRLRGSIDDATMLSQKRQSKSATIVCRTRTKFLREGQVIFLINDNDIKYMLVIFMLKALLFGLYP
jgi:hypothetical protein